MSLVSLVQTADRLPMGGLHTRLMCGCQATLTVYLYTPLQQALQSMYGRPMPTNGVAFQNFQRLPVVEVEEVSDDLLITNVRMQSPSVRMLSFTMCS